nr:immunoglobulin light chain junction region [Macaca mulatta]MOX48440.1 immunoglobulin light chain junction region [Macaca mulatta]MOX48902.1 immunoglobulin light chain junction region [Macaca mulatta]MOX48925.1 immunoglobulin light chain junction region [Macaca mulatta]MOX49463.1 immunoglobulin light chain junction region [Macaca mulatta]
CLQYLNVPFTF